MPAKVTVRRAKCRAARLLALALLVQAAGVLAATGEEIYKARCVLCHDAGAGQAPRIGVREEWTARVAKGRAALIAAAIRGVPNTAMTANGGHTDLSDAEIAATVDYIVARTGLRYGAAKVASQKEMIPGKSEPASVPDDALAANVAEALRKAMHRGIKVEARGGVVTLSGMVEGAADAKKAEAAARAVPGVTAIVNNLVAAGMFEWD